jgi:hypothetical protein
MSCLSRPVLQRQLWWIVCWVDILMDVIGGVENALREGCPGTTTGVSHRTILLLHIISVRPSKQPIMVRTFLKVYMELGSYFLFLQEQIKDIIITLVLGAFSTGVFQTPLHYPALTLVTTCGANQTS